MSDNLEKFVAGNKEKFNIFEPPERVWGRIENDLIQYRRRGRIKVYLLVAGAAAIFLIAFLTGILWRTGKDPVPVDFTNLDTGAFSPMELKDAEAYYAGIIDEKMDAIEPIIKEYPGLEEELQVDFTELEMIYTELKKDLRDNISNQEVIKAIIGNYRFRIDILEDMLVELESDTMAVLLNNEDYEL